MRILNTNNTNTFKAGLSSNIINLENRVSVKNIETFLKKNNGINAEFQMNNPVAIASLLSVNLLNDIAKYFKDFKFWTPSISVFNQNDLIRTQNINNFCIVEDQLVLRNKMPFKKKSIFYSKQNSLEEMNASNEYDYSQGKRSSNHFLAEIIHEMMHVIYLNHLAIKHSSNEKQILKNLQYKTFNSSENNIIENVIGKYATTPKNQYHEIFAETFTQLFCNVIDKNSCLIIKNPFENLQKYPLEFRAILKKVINE